MTKPMSRRALLAIAAATASLAASPAWSQAPFPNQPVKLVVPAPAGGAADILGRMVGQKLSEAWNVPVVVENKPGAGGSIGAGFVAKAAPDGYTILIEPQFLIQQRTLMKLPYDPIKDFTPVVRIATSTSMLALPAKLNLPAANLKEFVALVKANPGKFNYGSFGPGTGAHIQGALLNLQAGLDLEHVPYQGAAPLVHALVAGQVTSAFVDLASSRTQLESLRPLAVTGPARNPVLSNVPTFKELGYKDFEYYGWYGFFLPGATPAAIVSKFNDEINRALHMPDIIQKIEGLGLMVDGGTAEAFAQTVKTEDAMYARIIKEANVKIGQ